MTDDNSQTALAELPRPLATGNHEETGALTGSGDEDDVNASAIVGKQFSNGGHKTSGAPQPLEIDDDYDDLLRRAAVRLQKDEDEDDDDDDEDEWSDPLCSTWTCVTALCCWPFYLAGILYRMELNMCARPSPICGGFCIHVYIVGLVVFLVVLGQVPVLLQPHTRLRDLLWTVSTVTRVLLTCYLILLVWRTRQYMRRHYNIPTTSAESCQDVALACCCTSCVVAQMEDHVNTTPSVSGMTNRYAALYPGESLGGREGVGSPRDTTLA